LNKQPQHFPVAGEMMKAKKAASGRDREKEKEIAPATKRGGRADSLRTSDRIERQREQGRNRAKRSL